MAKEPRFVTVTWEDAWADGVDDTSIEKAGEKHRPIVMETRGWLLIDNETGVSIFYERTKDQISYRGRTFIPRGMIVTVTDFPAKRAPRRKKDPVCLTTS